MCQILERNHDDKEAYFDNIQINGLKMTYNNEEILPGVWQYMFKYFQHINHILASIELAGA